MSRYPDSGLRFVDQDEARSLVNSDGYYGGYLDSHSGHLHALNLALGIARGAGQHGARLYEQSAVTRISRVSSPTSGWEVETATGSVRAANVILAGNGYLRNLQPTVEARVMPINNFVVATEPLGRAAAEQLIRDRLAISDTRFVVYYFRITPDDRLLFGGGETYSYQYPKDIAGMVRGHLLRVFPQLNNTRIETRGVERSPSRPPACRSCARSSVAFSTPAASPARESSSHLLRVRLWRMRSVATAARSTFSSSFRCGAFRVDAICAGRSSSPRCPGLLCATTSADRRTRRPPQCESVCDTRSARP